MLRNDQRTPLEIYIGYLNQFIVVLEQLREIPKKPNWSTEENVARIHRLLGTLRTDVPKLRQHLLLLTNEDKKNDRQDGTGTKV